MYTQEEIKAYREGWLETHPDEDLDDRTIISCLRDESLEDLRIVQKMMEATNDWWTYRTLDEMPTELYAVCNALVNAHWYVKQKLNNRKPKEESKND